LTSADTDVRGWVPVAGPLIGGALATGLSIALLPVI